MITTDNEVKKDESGWSMQTMRVVDLLKTLKIPVNNIPEDTLSKKLYMMNTIDVVDIQIWDDSVHFWLEDNQELHT